MTSHLRTFGEYLDRVNLVVGRANPDDLRIAAADYLGEVLRKVGLELTTDQETLYLPIERGSREAVVPPRVMLIQSVRGGRRQSLHYKHRGTRLILVGEAGLSVEEVVVTANCLESDENGELLIPDECFEAAVVYCQAKLLTQKGVSARQDYASLNPAMMLKNEVPTLIDEARGRLSPTTRDGLERMRATNQRRFYQS